MSAQKRSADGFDSEVSLFSRFGTTGDITRSGDITGASLFKKESPVPRVARVADVN
jgi:hypothetical protein